MIFVTYFAGPMEGISGTQIWLHNVTEGRMRQISEGPIPHWNPVLFEWHEELYLAYKEGPKPWDWETHIVNIDDELNPHYHHVIDGGPVKNKPIIMSNGQLIAGHSTEHHGWKCYASILENIADFYQHWTNIPIDSSAIPGRGVIQPTLWESEPGHIHMFMRSAMGKICRADSEDYGRTWCPAYPTNIPNNNSGIDVVKVPMPSNNLNFRLFLVLNPVSGEGMSAHTRTPLAIMESYDNGDTFLRMGNSLESGPGEYSYPAIIHDPEEDQLLVSYTYNKHSIKLQTIPLGA
jgi:predicted neuraminidase